MALGLVPVLAPPYYANLLVPFFGYAIALLGFNLLFGYAGLLSFGHAMFLGLGAYGAAVIAGVLGIAQFEIVLIGVAPGRPHRRAADRPPVRALHRHLLRHAHAGLRHAGALGPVQVLPPDRRRQRHARPAHAILGLEFAAYNKIELLAGPFYYYCLALLVIAGLIMWRIVHSPFGLHLRALRDNAQKAEYLGVRVRQFRLAAFAISAVYGAIGGAILGFRTGLADPELVHWTHSGHLVFMTVLGGFSSFLGPIVGALALTLLQDQLQSYTQYWRFVLGAILAAVVIFFPRGLAGLAADVGAFVGRRREEAA